MHPILAFVARRPVRVGPTLTAAQRNVRPFENIVPNDLPDPIRSGDFVNEGKPWGKSRMPIFTSMAKEQIHSVMEDEFGRKPVLVPAAPNAAVPRGKQLPFKERTNIQRQQSTAYGSLVSLNPKTYDYGLFFARERVFS